jgi:hypothetical protein
MNNRLIGVASALLGLVIVGFAGTAFMRVLTFEAVSGIVVALFSAQSALLGLDLALQSRKIAATLAFIPAVVGFLFAFFLFF